MGDSKPRLFSRRDIAKIMVPMIFQQILTVFITMADSVMVSHTGEAAFAGVSLVSSLDTFLLTLFTALTAGGSVVLAQLMGQGHREETRAAAKQLLYASSAVALAVTVLVLLLRVPLLNFLFGDAEAAVLDNARSYFSIIALSFPFLAIEYSVSAIFRVQGDSMIALKISIGMNLLNIAGNALLIYGAGLGAVGAALATLFSRFVGAVVMICIGHNKKRFIYIDKLFHYKPDWRTIKRILKIGVPNGIENSMFQFGRLLTSSLVSSLGQAVIAANAATLQLANFQYNAGAAVQTTMVTVVGRCVGAEEKKQAKRYSWTLLGVGYLLVIAIVGVTCLFSRPFLGLFNLTEETFLLARSLLLWHGLFSAILWPAAFCLPPALRAASDVRFTMIISIVSMWCFRVALAYVLAPETVSLFGILSFSGAGLSIMGVWIGMAADWLFRAVVFVLHFLRGRWLEKYSA